MASPTEDLNRLKKALRIADILQAAGLSSREAAMAGDADTKMAAIAANYVSYTPSKETWDVVVQLLLDREMAKDRLRGKLTPPVADEDAPCLCTRNGDFEDVRGCPVHDA